MTPLTIPLLESPNVETVSPMGLAVDFDIELIGSTRHRVIYSVLFYGFRLGRNQIRYPRHDRFVEVR